MNGPEHITAILDEKDSAKVVQYLQTLVDNADDDGLAKNVYLNQLVELMEFACHNDDEWHSGESILKHTEWVAHDVLSLTAGRDDRQRRVLFLVALLHDIGKVVTYEVVGGRARFYSHQDASVWLAEAMIGELKNYAPVDYRRVMETVRLHDSAMILVQGREQSRGSQKYLNWIMREWLYEAGFLDDLVTFTMADTYRSPSRAYVADGMRQVLDDLREVGEKRAKAAQVAERRKSPSPETIRRVRSILVSTAPRFIPLLPDVRAVKKALGEAGEYGILRLISEWE
jgi:hypothetical protein